MSDHSSRVKAAAAWINENTSYRVTTFEGGRFVWSECISAKSDLYNSYHIDADEVIRRAQSLGWRGEQQ